VGILFDENDNRLCGLQPKHYVTMVSPHVGVRQGLSWFAERIGHLHPFYNTCSSLFLEDNLLWEMSQPSSTFMKALGSFQSRTVYANLEGDNRVPYHSAALYPLKKPILETPISPGTFQKNKKERKNLKKH
jgi:hypothetical protein